MESGVINGTLWVERPFSNDSHARLFRSRAPGAAEMPQDVPEQIGEGRFDKMARIALSDPDDEVWRYSIEVGAARIAGEQIRAFATSNPG